jgi:hypothetical protein
MTTQRSACTNSQPPCATTTRRYRAPSPPPPPPPPSPRLSPLPPSYGPLPTIPFPTRISSKSFFALFYLLLSRSQASFEMKTVAAAWLTVTFPKITISQKKKKNPKKPKKTPNRGFVLGKETLNAKEHDESSLFQKKKKKTGHHLPSDRYFSRNVLRVKKPALG